MHIGFIEPHLRLYGGIRRVIELSNHLVDRGHDVSIYHPEGTPCEWLECRARVGTTDEALGRSHQVLIFNDPNPVDLDIARRATADLKAFYVLALYERRLLKGFQPGLLMRRGTRMSVLRRALRSADLLLANSSWIHRWLRDELGLDNRLVIGGVDRDHFHPLDRAKDPGEGELRVLHSGDPRRRKGGDVVRAALELARERAPDLAEETYHGRGIRQADMAALHGSADVFVDAQWYAGWNNPVAEAMACGIPVVCTDIGGVQDLAFHDQTALLVEPGDSRGLADAIVRLKEDPGLRRRLRDNALEHVSRFTWDRSARRLEEVLEEGLREPGSRPGRSLARRALGVARRLVRRTRGRGVHFDKYDARGAYHWTAYEEDAVYRRHVDRILGMLEPGGTLLDVGCGDGLITAKLADAGFEVTGIDIEPTAIRLARGKRPDLAFQRRDIHDMDGTFDVVLVSEVIEHLADPDRLLEALKPLFRKRALITTPERDYYSDIDPYHTTEYGYHEYVALMRMHFDHVDVRAAGGHLYALVGHAPPADGTAPT